MTIWTSQYWLNVAEQALTGAALGVGFAMPDWQHPHWVSVLTYAGAGALAMAAKSIAANFTGKQRATPLLTSVAPHGWDPVETNPVGN